MLCIVYLLYYVNKHQEKKKIKIPIYKKNIPSKCFNDPEKPHSQGRIGNEKVICHVMGLGAPYRKF